MSFYVGLFLGISFGIGLIFGFARYEKIRSKRRSDLATTIAAFARMTVQDSRKILPPEFYPSWVVFTQRQKLSSIYNSSFSLFLSLSFFFFFFLSS
ncbi:Synaptotagmin-4 [Camellia lanceoleosa]|uniref:Synaptotagmin-4 n=1 Tax=Camellia lanceoleosa TaxID=1840588 RepID=A0ACC0G7X3_9ERIC|nr:Synaptotagmin-4 [Camellia lanceoleosa]